VAVVGLDGARRRAEDLTRVAVAALGGLPPDRVAPLAALARFTVERRN